MSKTAKERFLNTFSGNNLDKLVFSPRIYYWYNENKLFLKKKHKEDYKTYIPEKYVGKTQHEIYELLNASPRYIFETYYFSFFETKINPDSGIEIKNKKGKDRDEIIKIFKTPKGNLMSRTKHSHIQEYPIKTLEDVEIMKLILNNSSFHFNYANYEKAKNMIGDRGIVSEYIPRSPYMRLIIDYMGFVGTILFLKRYPTEIENFMSFINSWNDQIFNEVNKSPLKIINFGENIDANLSPPPYFKKYLVPYYNKRVKELHKAGKFCHIHMDGSLKDLLPFFRDLPFDGLEALTAYPQGDVSLEEIKNSIGSKILLDGVPSILFLNEYSEKYLLDYTKKVIDLFSPRLILGVSDEFPPNGNINKLELISKLVNNISI
ncbi:MAG: uroporphyrinogen decarboxylase family protein [Promethearchaeati archaeon]